MKKRKQQKCKKNAKRLAKAVSDVSFSYQDQFFEHFAYIPSEKNIGRMHSIFMTSDWWRTVLYDKDGEIVSRKKLLYDESVMELGIRKLNICLCEESFHFYYKLKKKGLYLHDEDVIKILRPPYLGNTFPEPNKLHDTSMAN